MLYRNSYQYRSWIEVSKKALLKNLVNFRKVIGKKVKLAAVVKANAYGHGQDEVPKIIEKKVDLFAVDNLTEALKLRNQGITKSILILGYTIEGSLKDAIENDISLVVYDKETLKKIASLKNSKAAKVHLKIETGLHRQGAEISDLLPLLKIIKENEKYILLEGVCTHFANIEDTIDSSFANLQFSNFKRALRLISKKGFKPRYLHSAASAATILYKETHLNLVRVGIALYGLWPSKESNIAIKIKGRKINLVPALSWKSRIAQIKKIEAGESVGYGRTWFAPRNSLIAIIPVGYSDGYDRGFSNNSQVVIEGQYAPVVGRVAMNMIMVDVTDVKKVKKESIVTLLGSGPGKRVTADELAGRIDTINYEIVSRINPLIPRIVVD